MNTTRLIYVTDPLCLWCYGISSNIEVFYGNLSDSIEKETINGGLFPATKAKKCDIEFINYLQQVAQHVTKLSNKKFSQLFWKLLSEPGFIYDTEPSAKASVTVKKLAGEKAMLNYIHNLQEAFFTRGENVMQPTVLAALAVPFGISQQEFINFYLSKECLNLTTKEYAEAKQLGVQGFPALIYLNGRQGCKLTSGFANAETLQKALNWAKQEYNHDKLSHSETCSNDSFSN